MSANRSPRQVRNAILHAPVEEYSAWQLLVSCAPCDRPHRPVPVSALGRGTIAEGIRRLMCSECRKRPTGVLIANGLAGWRQRTVALVGDGASL